MAFADVTALLVTYLSTQLSPTPVAAVVPEDRPDEFVTVRRVGGTVEYPVKDRPQMDFRVWDPSAANASARMLAIRELMIGLQGSSTLGVMVYKVDEILGLRELNDPLTGTPVAWSTLVFEVRADNAIRFTN